MTKQLIRTTLLLSLAILGLAAGGATAAPLQLSEAELFFELNDTDHDLGFHASIDGGPYTRLEIDDPTDRTILTLVAQGRLATQGLTQFFMESAEPPFDQLPPEDFFKRFPEGEYDIEVIRGNKKFETTVELSHVMAAPASGIEINGLDAAEDCDAVPLPSVSEPVTIDWEPVTESHPDVGDPGDGSVEIDRYQFFVEQGDVKFAVDLPPTVTEFVVPTEITKAGGTFKFEIIARTSDLNNTAIENCFIVP